MPRFLRKDDYDASLREEFLQPLIRDDIAVLHLAEDAALAEMRPYLSGKFDVVKCFAFDPPEHRDPLLLMFAKDITIYHLFATLQPAKLQGNNNLRAERYERAIQWLKEVAKGVIQPDLPIKETYTSPAMMRVSSNPKRDNHY